MGLFFVVVEFQQSSMQYFMKNNNWLKVSLIFQEFWIIRSWKQQTLRWIR